MANEEHLKILKLGVEAWNQWREQNPEIQPNLSEAALSRVNLKEVNLYKANLSGVDFSWAKLSGANLGEAKLSGANFREAKLIGVDFFKANLSGVNFMGANLGAAKLIAVDLSNANLIGANLIETNLYKANLRGAKLSGANLSEANLCEADFREADLREAFLIKSNMTKVNLSGAHLNQAHLVSSNLTDADLTGCSIYGLSAWDLNLNEKTKQSGLIITPLEAPTIMVDNLEVAQFIYLLLTNKKIRNVINPVANKAVLILGQFVKKLKEVLSAIADELRKMDFCPIIFDFQKSEEQDIIETVKTLASISKFIVAEVTSAKVIADELPSFVRDFAIPVVPLFQPSKQEPKPYASLNTLYKKYHWVFQPIEYKSKEHLIKILPDRVVKPAEAKRLELRTTKQQK
ncbi:MAG: pentapeptide repeat-containing protein [bacterium]